MIFSNPIQSSPLLHYNHHSRTNFLHLHTHKPIFTKSSLITSKVAMKKSNEGGREKKNPQIKQLHGKITTHKSIYIKKKKKKKKNNQGPSQILPPT
jgi:hypothetical protein